MSKFKQGLKFRHDNTRDTDIVIISEDFENHDSVELTVMFVLRTSGRSIHKQSITIQNLDADKWKRVIEDD